MPALRPADETADRAQAGQGHGAPVAGQALARREVVHGDLGDGVAGPRGDEQRPVGQLGAVEDRVVLEHRLVVLREQVAPGAGPGVGRRRDGEPPARGVEVGGDVEAPVAVGVRTDVGVEAGDQVGEGGRRGVGAVQGGDPDVVAGGGAGRRRDDQPPAVERDGDPVVAADVEAGAEDLDVVRGIGPEPVEPDPAVVLLLVLGEPGGVEPADVVVAPGPGEPRDGGVARPVDRALDLLARGHVEHAQHALLRAALGQLVGQQVPLLAGLPGIERREAGRVERDRVDEHALGPVGVDREQDAVLLRALPPHEEATVAPPDRDAHDAGGQQVADPVGEGVATGPAGGVLGVQVVLRVRPGLRARVVGVLQPPVRVGHRVAVQVVDEREALGIGVVGGLLVRHGRHPRTRGLLPADGPGGPMRWDGRVTRTLWIDASAGIAGDMLLGALVDLGVPLRALQEAVDAVVPGATRLSERSVTRAGLRAIKVDVEADEDGTARPWAEVRRLLGESRLDDRVRDLALRTFERLAAAEARVHGVPVEEVHFHEVGALDAIADVVATCAGVAALGAVRVVLSPVALGSGSVRTAHGTLPVPAPAVLELMQGRDVAAPAPDAGELATPTGVALATTLASASGPLPAMTVGEVGVGAGTRDVPGRPERRPTRRRRARPARSARRRRASRPTSTTSIRGSGPTSLPACWRRVRSTPGSPRSWRRRAGRRTPCTCSPCPGRAPPDPARPRRTRARSGCAGRR